MKSIFLIAFIFTLLAGGAYAADIGGDYATKSYLDASEKRTEAIVEKLAKKGVMVDGKLPTVQSFEGYGLNFEENAEVWEKSGGGPVLMGLGIEPTRFYNNPLIRKIQGLLLFVVMVLLVIGALNKGTLITELPRWSMKMVGLFFVLFQPQLIYAFAMMISSAFSTMTAIALFESDFGEDMQMRLALASPTTTESAKAYRQSYDRAVTHMQPYFTHTSIATQQEINLQINNISEGLSQMGLIAELPPLESPTPTGNLALNQEAAYQRFRFLAETLLASTPALKDSGAPFFVGGINKNILDIYEGEFRSNFNPFISTTVRIIGPYSPWYYFEKFNPVVDAIRIGKYTKQRMLANGSTVGRKTTSTLDDKEKAEMLNHFKDSIYATSMAYWNVHLLEVIKVRMEAADTPTSQSVLNTLEKQQDLQASLAEEPTTNKLADMFHKAVGFISQFFIKIVVGALLWVFGATAELALLALWIVAPLWLHPKTERAFTGLVGLLMTSTIYPVVMVVSMFFMDALFAQLTRFIFGNPLAAVGTTAALGTSAGLVATSIAFLTGGPLFAVVGALTAVIGGMVFIVAYTCAVSIIAIKTPAITRKILSGQLPISEYAQAGIGGIVSGAMVAVGAAGAGAAAGGSMAKLGAQGAKTAGAAANKASGAIRSARQGVANRIAELPERAGPLSKAGARARQHRVNKTGAFSDKRWTAEAGQSLKQVGARISKASKSAPARGIRKFSTSAATEAGAMLAAGGDLRKYQTFRTMAKVVRQDRKNKKGFKGIDGESPEEQGDTNESN